MRDLSGLLTVDSGSQRLASHHDHYYGFSQFKQAVSAWMERFAREPDTAYALYCEESYPFAVLLFGLLHAGKQVWLAANNRPGTAGMLKQQGCRLLGDWSAPFDYQLNSTTAEQPVLCALDPSQPQLVIFTSGSSGEAKPIHKSLGQLQTEIDTLEKLWGPRLADSEVLATVSHQHIYGLLFRVLWPLAAGRCFHSEAALNPEILLRQARVACWIASPAHLKRLDDQSPWSGLAALAAIFSSGGPLPADAAAQLSQRCGQAAIEVYGSSETGGIGWRQWPDTGWTPFENMHLRQTEESVFLDSPYLSAPVALDDQISLQADGRFLLLGRNDRIAKVEEKRVSLSGLEQRLIESPWIDDAVALVLKQHRDSIAVCAALSPQALELQQRAGRKALIEQLRQVLQPWYEAMLMPRKWLFLDKLPVTAQAKLDTALVRALLDGDSKQLPQLRAASLAASSASLQLKIPENLVYFPDHFRNFPILPGVVQIGWAEYYGKLLFSIANPFTRMEAVKFAKPIQPGLELQLRLDWKAEAGKLNFSFSSAEQNYSGGRLVYLGEAL